MGCKTTVIAEVGENHLGNMDMAQQMIVTAADAGAQIVKFQSYRGRDTAPDDPEREFFKQVELSDEIHFELKKLAEDKGAHFMSTPFTVERARFLVEKVGMKHMKVASGTPPPRPLPSVTMSGRTPLCSSAIHRPVRPMQVCTSSRMRSAPAA